MHQSLIEKLSEISEEEKRYLNGESAVEKDLYFKNGGSIINGVRFLGGDEGDKLIGMRTHTRFIDFPVHSHDYVEMMYVCEGQITHEIEGERIVLKKGGLIMLNRHVKHSIAKAGRDDIGVNLIVSQSLFEAMVENLGDYAIFTDFFVENMLDHGESRHMLFNVGGILPIENLIESLVYMLVNENEVERDVLLRSMGLLISYLSHYPKTLISKYKAGKYIDGIIKQIVDYIDIHYKNASLSELAEQLGFSESYLCRWIRKNMDSNFKQLLQSKRFTVAQYLLRTTELSAEDVAASVGYENTSYFYKQFGKRCKMTPGKWRRYL